MSLILAIEADKRQATLLASIGRRVGAELVIAPTAERGLDAIDGRVPDLILTSALLSPRDDAAIATRLRELDSAASHVQTLTVPVLAKPARRAQQPAGLLGKLRGTPASAAPVGCDPSLFADQVTEYLERAAAERLAREEADAAAQAAAPAPTETAPVAEPPVEVLEPAVWRQPPPPSLDAATVESPAPYIVSAADPNPIVIAPIVVANVNIELPDVPLAERVVLPAEPTAPIETELAAAVEPIVGWREPAADDTPVVHEPEHPVEAIAVVPSSVDDTPVPAPTIEAAAEPEPAPMVAAVASAETEAPFASSPVIASEPETVMMEVAEREESVVLPAIVLSEPEPVIDVPALTTEAEPQTVIAALAEPDESIVVPPIAASEAEPAVDLLALAPSEAEPPAPKAEAPTAGDEEIELIEELRTPPDVVELNADVLSTDIDAALREFEAALAHAEALAADHHAASAPPTPRREEVVAVAADEPSLTRDAAPAAIVRAEAWAELARTAALWPALEGLAAELPPTKPVEAPVAAVASAPVAVADVAPPVAAVPAETPIAAAPAETPVAAVPAETPVAAVPAETPVAAVPAAIPAPEPVVEAVAATAAETIAPPVEAQVAPAPVPEPAARPPLTVAPAATESAAKPAAEPRPKKKRKPKPVQDEWGLFDPDQCGFAALLDKLNELSADDAA